MITSKDWLDWVNDPEGNTNRRRLAIQTFYALRLDYGRWVSFERAVEGMRFTGVSPERANILFKDAGVLQLLKEHDYNPAKVRRAATS